MKRSKKYQKAEKLVDSNKDYSLEEAVKLLPQLSTSAFESSVEMHININLSDKQKKASIKGSVTLPHQVGSSVKIAVITTPDHFEEAKDADEVGGEEMAKKIQDGWDDFDILIATPEVMPKIAVLGRVLGPKGKMPNPKNETVTNDLKKVIASYKKGKTNFKVDDQGGIHLIIGKTKMGDEKLLENARVFLKKVYAETVKLQANPFKSIYLSPTMGPSVRLDVAGIVKELT